MIYIVNGFPGSGKTTFEQFCKEQLKEYCQIISSIQFVKTIARICGWDGTKTEKNRKFLSDLKDILTQWDDVPFKEILESIDKIKLMFKSYDADFSRAAIFIDCREPEEIERLKTALNAKTIIVRRNEIENQSHSNHADSHVLDYTYDLIIENNGTLEDLKEAAHTFLRSENLLNCE